MGGLYIVREYSLLLKPHLLKETSGGRPVAMVPLVLFSDDTSGNKSKKWHKFDSWSFVLGGLPHHENSKISNLHFCAVLMWCQLWISQEK